jgi:ABC-type transport system involved in cytochrome c biogenesis permease subunit
VFAITIGYLATLTVGIIAMSGIVGRAIGRFGPRQSDAFRHIGSRIAAAAVALTLAGILLGAFWSRGHLGPYWQWDAREVGGLCVLAWSCVLLSCLRWRSVSASSAMLAGVIGNVVVLLGWLGPPLLDGRASHGYPAWYKTVLCAAVMTHLAWAYAGMLPPGWLRLGRTADGR